MGRILVIDDDPRLRRTIVRALKGAGHEIRDAEDGAVGVEMVRAEQFDIVITDILMPEKEGIETILTIRREHPSIRIIAISGGGASQTMAYLDFAAKLGADATLAKPFRPAELLDTIVALFRIGVAIFHRQWRVSGERLILLIIAFPLIFLGVRSGDYVHLAVLYPYYREKIAQTSERTVRFP